eukprot:8857807-Lingulodinium_polyedra.AAC.1
MRIRRRLKFSGHTIGADGVLTRVELTGPSSFAEWESCFAILKTALIMLDQVAPATVEFYYTVVKEYHHRYGAEIWALLYQADV